MKGAVEVFVGREIGSVVLDDGGGVWHGGCLRAAALEVFDVWWEHGYVRRCSRMLLCD